MRNKCLIDRLEAEVQDGERRSPRKAYGDVRYDPFRTNVLVDAKYGSVRLQQGANWNG